MGEPAKVIHYWACTLETDLSLSFNSNHFEYVVRGLCNVYDVLKIVIPYVNNAN